MRAYEFIVEEKGLRGKSRSSPHTEFEKAHPGLITPAGRGDLYIGRYYDFYRVSTLAGMSPEELSNVDEISFTGNLPMFSAYTEEDRKKLKLIMKKLGMKPKDHISKGSKEIESTQIKSPVKSFKGFK